MPHFPDQNRRIHYSLKLHGVDGAHPHTQLILVFLSELGVLPPIIPRPQRLFLRLHASSVESPLVMSKLWPGHFPSRI